MISPSPGGMAASGARHFYQDALRYAQSQWISGKPAQAILQLDKAWMADLPADHPVLRFPSAALSGACFGSCGEWPRPETAAIWETRCAISNTSPAG